MTQTIESPATLISSQRHLAPEVVARKIEAGDFEVQVSPVFSYDGQRFRVVLDGHHSLAAALEAGVEPTLYEVDQREHDALRWLDDGDPETFLACVHMGSDWYDALTGKDVW